MSYCRVRSRFGREETPEPSRFLTELPAAEVRWVGKGEKVQRTVGEQKLAARPHLDAIKALLGGISQANGFRCLAVIPAKAGIQNRITAGLPPERNDGGANGVGSGSTLTMQAGGR